MELVARFPPSEVENLPVWQHILLRALSQDVLLRVETDIIDLAQKVLTDWESAGHRLGQVDKVVRATLMSDAGYCDSTHGDVFVLPQTCQLTSPTRSFVCPECTSVGPLSSGSGPLIPR